MTKTVALLVGGWSAEREVSLTKGKAVEQALKEEGYQVHVVDVTHDISKLISALTPRPDVVFNNLYGKGGEDGCIQGLLECMELPYTHSNVMASSIGMNKVLTKEMAISIGVRTPEWKIAEKEDVLSETVMSRPYVVKPIDEGSSVGVRIIFEGENQKPLDSDNWEFSDKVLVESYVPGREIHVTVLDGKAQGVTEIICAGRFFDYEAKYHDESTRLITPAEIPEIVEKTAMDYAERVFRVLGCSGLARCDLRYDDTKTESDGLYFLEINTMPGLAPGSVAVVQPELNGMSYNALCAHLVETARCHGKIQEDEAPSSIDVPKRASA